MYKIHVTNMNSLHFPPSKGLLTTYASMKRVWGGGVYYSVFKDTCTEQVVESKNLLKKVRISDKAIGAK